MVALSRREVITGRKVSEGKREVSIGDRLNIGSGYIKTWVLGKNFLRTLMF
jgi:hypothetical protein